MKDLIKEAILILAITLAFFGLIYFMSTLGIGYSLESV